MFEQPWDFTVPITRAQERMGETLGNLGKTIGNEFRSGRKLEREQLEKAEEKSESARKEAKADKEAAKEQGYKIVNQIIKYDAEGNYEAAETLMQGNSTLIKETFPSMNVEQYLDSPEERIKDSKLVGEFREGMKTFDPMKPEDRSKGIDMMGRMAERPNLGIYVKSLGSMLGEGMKQDKPETESQYKAKILEKGAKDYESLTPGERKIFDKETYIKPEEKDEEKVVKPKTESNIIAEVMEKGKRLGYNLLNPEEKLLWDAQIERMKKKPQIGGYSMKKNEKGEWVVDVGE